MPPRDPDEHLVPTFKTIALPHEDRSRQAGRPIYEDVEHVEIRAPGFSDVKVYPATAFSHWAVDPYTHEQKKVSYAERFRYQYQQFKAHQIQTKSGTPLEHAPFLTEARRAELRALNVYTVEQLADVEGQELKNLGMYGRDYKNKAAEYIAESKASAPNKQMEAQLEALVARNALLEEDMAAMKAREAATGEFERMTDDDLKQFISANTGQPTHGNIHRKTLIRMAQAASDK